jgi:hypothetical protein
MYGNALAYHIIVADDDAAEFSARLQTEKLGAAAYHAAREKVIACADCDIAFDDYVGLQYGSRADCGPLADVAVRPDDGIIGYGGAIGYGCRLMNLRHLEKCS